MRRVIYLITILVLLNSVNEARQRSFGLGFTVGAGFPTGEFEKDPNPGFGFKGYFGFGLSNNFELYSSFGFYSFQGDTDLEDDDPDDIIYQDGGSFIALPWAFGVRYYLMDSNFKPYIMLNASINFNKYNAPKILNSDNTVSGGGSVNVTEFGYNVGAGTLYKISRHTELEFAALYNSILDGDQGKFFSLEFGISWSF